MILIPSFWIFLAEEEKEKHMLMLPSFAEAYFFCKQMNDMMHALEIIQLQKPPKFSKIYRKQSSVVKSYFILLLTKLPLWNLKAFASIFASLLHIEPGQLIKENLKH